MRSDDAGYEPSEVSDRGAVSFAVATFLVLTVLAVLVRVHEWRLDARTPPRTSTVPWKPRSPQLETWPGQAYDDYARDSKLWLNGSGWIDRSHGVAHIPIERAKELILREGAP